MKRLAGITTMLLLIGAFGFSQEAQAATVYANWLKVKQIRYHANTDVYLVSFEGNVGTNETDDSGNACSSYAFTVIKASADGVSTTPEKVDRMVQALEIARATDLKVLVWVHRCSAATNATTYPKAYAVFSGP